MIGTVIILAADDQILSGIQAFQPSENGFSFFKSGIFSAVKTETEEPFSFQKTKCRIQCGQAALGLCGQPVVRAWQISEIENDAGYGFRLSILLQMFM